MVIGEESSNPPSREARFGEVPSKLAEAERSSYARK
jgi:hypothetical protein